jgi:hypothetical protein
MVNGMVLQVKWLQRGWPADVRRWVQGLSRRPDVVIAPEISEGAKKLLGELGIGWLDETGAAEINLDRLVISRDGRRRVTPNKPQTWTATTLGVAEAILTGVRPTVQAISQDTGLSIGTTTKALSLLSREGFLRASDQRGPRSGRHLMSWDKLLDAYVAAINQLPSPHQLRLGVLARDPASEILRVARGWERSGRPWAATGALAASVMAPLFTQVSTLEVLVAGSTMADLDLAAEEADVEPMKGGRLVLRLMPSQATARLSRRWDQLRCAPWPRVFADLRRTGVRGEEAADHLLSVVEKPVEMKGDDDA